MSETAETPRSQPIPRPEREEQAIREVGSTGIGAVAARVLAVLFLVTIAGVPVVELARAGGRPAWWGRLASGFAGPEGEGAPTGLFAANRRLLAAIDAAETRLDDDSLLRGRLLPRFQWALTATLGLGNEQAYPGDEGWLFYRPDVDHVTGPGFLEPEVLERRRRRGDAWERPPQPDPVLALTDFAAALAERGATLVAMPTPAKPEIHPERLTSRIGAGTLVRNPSWDELLERLAAAGVEVFDPAPALAEAHRESGVPQYLRADTHWTPEAMELAAARLAARLEELGRRDAPRARTLTPPDPDFYYLRREAVVEQPGDIAVMLRLPDDQGLFPPQRVTVRPVLAADGRSWKPERGAELLLLGDSFTNIYSDPGLGWGAGAGLAEQLSYHLGRPLDRIAMNAGGAAAAREALARALASGEDRLAGKRVVVYQFAVRELSGGDWRLVDLTVPPRGSG